MSLPRLHSPAGHCTPDRLLVPALLLGLSLAAPDAAAKTFVIPHIIESSGRITDTPYTFDTTIFATYSPGLAGSSPGAGASVDLYLYGNTGALLANNGAAVCAPCTFALDSNTRKVRMSLQDLIEAQGGSFDAGVKLGYAVVVVGGADPDHVSLQGFILNAHTGPFDLSTTPLRMATVGERCDESAPGGEPRRVFVLPHVLEAAGSTSNTPFTFDTTIFAVYTGGQAGIPSGPVGAGEVALYLYDDEGSPLTGAGGQPVCAPCLHVLGGGQRKASINLENAFQAAGGVPGGAANGIGVVAVSGEVDAVNLQGFVVNSHTGPFDLALSGSDPFEVADQQAVPVLEEPILEGAMRVVPNPARGGASLSFRLVRATDVAITVHDVTGRRVADLGSGRRDAGAHTLAWDGIDASGRKAPAGVYFARLVGEGVTLQNRIVVID